MTRTPEILVLDDDAELAATLREFLELEGYAAIVVRSAEEAVELASASHLAVAIVDLVMPGADGLTVMQRLHAANRDLPVVIMTGFGTIETAVEAMKRGAEDYITKPFDRDGIRKKIGRLMELHRLRHRVAQLEADLVAGEDAFHELVFVSPAMQKIVERARAAAATDASVLIVGETGTGKEKLARALHRASRRAAAPFLAVNCGALPRDLVESELFGVRKGAYTGAYADSPGVFASANNGTVFLDEIGEMPRDAQVKLLRVLQEKELRPLGAARTVPVNIRVIAATNRPLDSLRAEVLREDLYFRLATVIIEVPPLRTRPEDILVFAQWFVARLAEKYGRHITISRPGVERLVTYTFPGNVRELENLLESIAALSTEDPQVIGERDVAPLLVRRDQSDTALPLALDDMERVAIERAIRLCNGNRTKAAALLGISRDTLYRKLRENKADAETA